MRVRRTLRAGMALLLYVAAAVGGLAAGYFATAPGSLGERSRIREERRSYERRLAEELAEMEAAAAFLRREEARTQLAARPPSAGAVTAGTVSAGAILGN